jgi:hypothetical protein
MVSPFETYEMRVFLTLMRHKRDFYIKERNRISYSMFRFLNPFYKMQMKFLNSIIWDMDEIILYIEKEQAKAKHAQVRSP